MMAVRRLRVAMWLWAFAASAQSPAVPRDSAEAERLEVLVQSHPEDSAARAQLIRYYARFRIATDRSQILRGQHIAALVERDPSNTVLGEPAGTLDAEGGA